MSAYDKLHNKGNDMKTSNSGGDFKIAPEGMHVARCFKLVDCGTHVNKTFGNLQHLGYIFWELPRCLIEDGEHEGQPYSVMKRYTLSHNEKANLRADLEGWYGKTFDTAALDASGGFDLNKVMGRPAMINVVHSDDKKYANIKSVNPLPNGMECPPAINPPFVYELMGGNITELSDKMQEFIKTAKEFDNKTETILSERDEMPTDFDDDIPF